MNFKRSVILIVLVVATISIVNSRRNKFNLNREKKCKCHKSDPKASFSQNEGLWYCLRYSGPGWSCGHFNIRNAADGQQVWAGGHKHEVCVVDGERGEPCYHYYEGMMYQMGDKHIWTRRDDPRWFMQSTVVWADYSSSGCLGMIRCQTNTPNKTVGYILCKKKQIGVHELDRITKVMEKTAPALTMQEVQQDDQCYYPASRRGVMDKLVNEYYGQRPAGQAKSKLPFDDEL